jgi:hypothetical protein
MICPNCKTTNDDSAVFCINCGTKFVQTSETVPLSVVAPMNTSARTQLAIMSGQFLLSLLFLYILKALLDGSSYVENLYITKIDLSVATIINTFIYVVMIGILIGFARMVGNLWNGSFPKVMNGGSALISVAYLLMISMAYRGLAPFIVMISDEPDLLQITQVVFLMIGLSLAIWAFLIVYQNLPQWLGNINLPPISNPSASQETEKNKNHNK